MKTPKYRNKQKKNKRSKGVSALQLIEGVGLTKINYPLTPNSYHVKLQFTEDFLTSSSTAGSTDKWGLNHWANRIPGYGSSYFGIYNYCQVLRVDYQFTVTSSLTIPYASILVAAPYQTSTSYSVLTGYRGRIIKSSPGSNAMNKLVLRASYYPSKVEGINTSLDKASWYTLSTMAAFAPQDTDSHSVWWGVAPIDGSTVGSYNVLVNISYHCHFFSPENTVLSAQKALEEQSFVDYEPEESHPQKMVISSLQKLGTSKLLKKV